LRAASVSSSRRRGAKDRRGLEALVARLGALGDRAQRGDELVERRLGFGLGRLDQHRAVDDQREIHGHRVEALVDQRLGESIVLSPRRSLCR
jgi:hypothetical protein